jgi:hypothetical protein
MLAACGLAALGAPGALGCRRGVPTFPVVLADEVLDPGAMQRPGRLEYRRLLEPCAGSGCASVEVAWWADPSPPAPRVVAVRATQLGGARASATIGRRADRPAEIELSVRVVHRALFGSAEASSRFVLGADGTASTSSR